jgi:mannose-6-phosphate isomerase-like protein (cupin superfamily)
MSNPDDFPYATFLDLKFPALSVVDVPGLVEANSAAWYNQTLCKVNDSVVRLGVMQGEYHWHKHDADDEFFFVLDGVFIIDLEDRVVELQARQGFVVPKGVVHRTRAPHRAVILMVETAAIVPTGDGP